MDNPAIVHDINVLTVVASESYKDFVAALQKEISDSLSVAAAEGERRPTSPARCSRPMPATVEITPSMAKQIYRYLREERLYR